MYDLTRSIENDRVEHSFEAVCWQGHNCNTVELRAVTALCGDTPSVQPEYLYANLHGSGTS